MTKLIPANPVVAVAGATGAVGREFLNVLHQLDFPASEVRALASARSAGKELPWRGLREWWSWIDRKSVV